MEKVIENDKRRLNWKEGDGKKVILK